MEAYQMDGQRLVNAMGHPMNAEQVAMSLQSERDALRLECAELREALGEIVHQTTAAKMERERAKLLRDYLMRINVTARAALARGAKS